MMNNTKITAMAQAHKDPASRRGSSGSNHGGSRTVGLVNAEGAEDGVKVVSGIVQLMSNLHHNAAAVVTSKTNLNGPDQFLPHGEHYTTVRRNGAIKLRREEHGLASEEPISVPTLLEETAKVHPEVLAMQVKREGEWVKWTYEKYLSDVQLIARAYINIGLHRHHSVVLLGANSPEWVIGNMAAIFAGGVSVGLYPSMSSDEISRVCIDAKADLILVENEALLKRILLIQHKLPNLKAIVQLRGEPPLSDKRRLYKSHKKHIITWDQLFEIGIDLPEHKLFERLRRVAINQCCSILYTSGTDSTIKGVMLSHDNITWSSKMLLGLTRAPGFNKLPHAGEEIVMAYLPHSTIAAQLTDIFYTISVAGTLGFAASDEFDQECILSDDDAFFNAVEEINPTVFFGPPSVYERMYHRLRLMKRATSGVQHLVLDWSNKALKNKHMKNDVSKGMVPTRKISAIRNAVAKNTVTKRYKEYLGFKPQTAFLCQGATLSKEVLEYLAGFDILVHETYGQSETSGLLCANIPKRYCKLGTTGKAMPGVKIQLDMPSDGNSLRTPMVDGDPGQLLGWGRNIFMGYLNRENETRDIFVPGKDADKESTTEGVAISDKQNWLKLGDLGFIDEDGFLVVLGKSEDFITLNTNELISPTKIEQLVRLELPCVKQAIVIGEGQGYLAVLLTLHTNLDEKTKQPGKILSDDAQRWFKNTRFKMETVDDVLDGLESGVQHAFQAGIDRVNQTAKTLSHEIKDWRIMPLPFTYANGELGLTGKIKRRAILERHATCIGSMFVHPEMHAFNSKCESNMAPQPHQKHAMFQIKEEDETKTSRQNSPMQQQRRCQSQILLKSKYKVSSKDKSDDTLREIPDLASARFKPNNNQLSKSTSEADTENKPAQEQDSDSDEDEGADERDPEVKEKERKISEQRIAEIVHYDGGIKLKSNVLPINKEQGSTDDTPITAPKFDNSEDDGLSEVNLTDESKNKNDQTEITVPATKVGRKISDNFSEVSSTVAINSQQKTMR